MLLELTLALFCVSIVNLILTIKMTLQASLVEAALQDIKRQESEREVRGAFDARSALNERLDQLQSMRFSKMSLIDRKRNEKGRTR